MFNYFIKILHFIGSFLDVLHNIILNEEIYIIYIRKVNIESRLKNKLKLK